ncbi:MAG: hypothetical protein KJ970_07830 [Candidatus Eisenbacteria bacterium]|uniref:DinB family protein n=1 Tax=Eiseniibacteriota bacterium TaxID=2212470 RepID=A0A948RTY0_UNCEI|nr:hypothetical protein [Candidatus Eisenbacteria bacterium]MBU1948049.1 hypothetical protein [Candidatus Eisenbacteria bacterium]MBU2690825.1 hypothetical protein [Candidatus Eisenbacteria bacterium]
MNVKDGLPDYLYAGARAMVILHDHHLRSCFEMWKRAKRAGLALPATADPDYASLETLLLHICACARGYMVWMCDVLQLPDPGIEPAPGKDTMAAEANDYIDHLAMRWQSPLAGVPEDKFGRPEYESRWKVKYCVDAMLEHAVMHPIRHEFQLEELLKKSL